MPASVGASRCAPPPTRTVASRRPKKGFTNSNNSQCKARRKKKTNRTKKMHICRAKPRRNSYESSLTSHLLTCNAKLPRRLVGPGAFAKSCNMKLWKNSNGRNGRKNVWVLERKEKRGGNGSQAVREPGLRTSEKYRRTAKSAHAMTAVWARGPLVLATLGRFFADFLFVALIFQRAPQPSALDSRFRIGRQSIVDKLSS